jgi:hypothetical protein
MGVWSIAPPLLTLALDRGQWSASRTGRFTPGKEFLVPFGQEARWAPESVWMLWSQDSNRLQAGWPGFNSQQHKIFLKDIAISILLPHHSEQ